MGECVRRGGEGPVRGARALMMCKVPDLRLHRPRRRFFPQAGCYWLWSWEVDEQGTLQEAT